MTFGVGVAVAVAVAVGSVVGSLLGDAAGVAVTTGVGVLSAGTVVFCAIFFLIVTVMVPTFLVFFFNFSFTVILTLPAFFAVITPDLLTEAFLLEALKEYFAFFFFDFIEIFFFCPTVNVSFFLTSFAFAAAVAGVKALSVDTASAKHKPMLMVCFFNMFMINPPHIILWLYFSIV